MTTLEDELEREREWEKDGRTDGRREGGREGPGQKVSKPEESNFSGEFHLKPHFSLEYKAS